MKHILQTFENNPNSKLSILDLVVISLMDEANLSVIQQSDIGIQILKKMDTLGDFKRAKEMLCSAFPKICLTLHDVKNVKVNDERALQIEIIDSIGITHQLNFNSQGQRLNLA